MTISWTKPQVNAWIAVDENEKTLFSVCKLNSVTTSYIGGETEPHTRWCVFYRDLHEGYCGDLPITLSEKELKAAAIVLWRLRDTK